MTKFVTETQFNGFLDVLTPDISNIKNNINAFQAQDYIQTPFTHLEGGNQFSKMNGVILPKLIEVPTLYQLYYQNPTLAVNNTTQMEVTSNPNINYQDGVTTYLVQSLDVSTITVQVPDDVTYAWSLNPNNPTNGSYLNDQILTLTTTRKDLFPINFQHPNITGEITKNIALVSNDDFQAFVNTVKMVRGDNPAIIWDSVMAAKLSLTSLMVNVPNEAVFLTNSNQIATGTFALQANHPDADITANVQLESPYGQMAFGHTV